MKDWYQLNILTPLKLENEAIGRGFLEFLSEVGLFPEKVSNHEPVRTRVSSVDDALKFWHDPLLWRRGPSPSAQGMVMMTLLEQHDKISIQIAVTVNGASAALQAMNKIHEVFPVDLGSVHYVGQVEIDENLRDRDEAASVCLQLGPSTHRIVKGLPDPVWAMVFGAPYVDLIGRERLMSAPAHTIEEIVENNILVQLTPDINDVKKDYASFKERRAAFKNHLGQEFFMRRKGEDHDVLAPQFRFVNKIPFDRT